ncbi:MAG: hypothetical protein IID31_06680 [Planctomycetes bacterium]|nr:hypothetical protein [Planctomycetota bacterium]
MTRTRTIALALAAAALASTLAGGYFMARRVGLHNETSGRRLYGFINIGDRSFTFASRDVTLTDEPDGHGGEVLVVRYGDEELTLRPTRTPDPAGMPGLTRHMNWMRVLRFAPLQGVDGPSLERAIRSGRITDRLAIVIHIPPQGAEPGSFAEVWKRSSWFDFYEFLPDGTFLHQRKAYPESDKALARRQARARREGKPIPERSADDLNPNSWRYQAASIVRSGRDRPTMLPGAMSPDLAFTEDAVGSMGWTLPFTSVSIFALAASLCVAFAPARDQAGAS